tara:strand:- start:858 stop:1169 length:312 start_codon:yes stop_codon:yes gene_type:complete
MALRNSWEETGSLYNAARHLSAAEANMAVLMFITGLDWANDASLTIDDVINAIRDNYSGPEDASLMGTKETISAANNYLETERSLLLQLTRRAYRQRQIAEAA